MSTEEVSSLLARVDKLNPLQLRKYQQALVENNINGLVLTQCNLDQLRDCLNMKFGDWQLFRSTILSLRDYQDREFVANEQRSPERPAASSFKKSRSDTSRKSIHFSDSEASHSNMMARSSNLDQIDSVPSYTYQSSQSSTDTQVTQGDSMSAFEVIPEVDERTSSQESQPKLKRQDSIVAEMIYESALVNEFMHNFTEISEGEDERSADDDYDTDLGLLLEDSAPSSRDRGLPVQFTLNSYDGDTSDILSDDNEIVPDVSFHPSPETQPLMVDSSQQAESSVPILNMPRLEKQETNEKLGISRKYTSSQPSIPSSIDSKKRNQYELKPLLEQGKAASTTSSGFPNYPPSVFEMSEDSLSSLAVVDETRHSTSPLSLQQSIEQYTMQELQAEAGTSQNTGQAETWVTSPDAALITGKDKQKKGKAPEEFV